MTTTAFIGSQTILRMGDGASPEIFTTLFEVASIGDFGQENDLLEATHMQSTAKEFVYGLPDGAELAVVVNYNPTNATHVALLAAQAARTTKNFELVLPTGGSSRKFVFSALVKGWHFPDNPNEIVKMTLSLKISGSITGPIPS